MSALADSLALFYAQHASLWCILVGAAYCQSLAMVTPDFFLENPGTGVCWFIVLFRSRLLFCVPRPTLKSLTFACLFIAAVGMSEDLSSASVVARYGRRFSVSPRTLSLCLCRVNFLTLLWDVWRLLLPALAGAQV